VSRSYLVQLPRAEARHLAGIGWGWPASPEATCVQEVREWLRVLCATGPDPVPVSRVAADLAAILARVPAAGRPVRGPFAPGGRGPAPPGRVEYLGAGIVRLDEAAVSTLAQLRDGEDFRVVRTDPGPVLTIGADRYLARPQEPDPKS
jgi:hypothetical protein